MGFAKGEMSGQGFRAIARTILDVVLHVNGLPHLADFSSGLRIHLAAPHTIACVL
ncbi:MAG: hypothetical protein ABIR84_06735 [Candidatus Nitrotoga sp.]